MGVKRDFKRMLRGTGPSRGPFPPGPSVELLVRDHALPSFTGHEADALVLGAK